MIRSPRFLALSLIRAGLSVCLSRTSPSRFAHPGLDGMPLPVKQRPTTLSICLPTGPKYFIEIKRICL